ncbi:hypothetical protein V8E36_008349 [Tilletia maclaganii]
MQSPSALRPTASKQNPSIHPQAIREAAAIQKILAPSVQTFPSIVSPLLSRSLNTHPYQQPRPSSKSSSRSPTHKHTCTHTHHHQHTHTALLEHPPSELPYPSPTAQPFSQPIKSTFSIEPPTLTILLVDVKHTRRACSIAAPSRSSFSIHNSIDIRPDHPRTLQAATDPRFTSINTGCIPSKSSSSPTSGLLFSSTFDGRHTSHTQLGSRPPATTMRMTDQNGGGGSIHPAKAQGTS